MKNISFAVKHNNIKSQMNRDDSFGFLKWIIKTEITIALVVFVIICIYKLIPQNIIFEIKHYINKRFIINTEKNETYNNYDKDYSNIINKSIEKNKNLNIEEKEFIKKYLEDEINENYKFIDIEKVSKKLETLKINYNQKYYYDEKQKEYKSSNLEYEVVGIAGSYNAFFNKINIYEQIEEHEISSNYSDIDFGFNECNKEALFHEVNHLLAKNSLNTITNKSIFSEIINELFTKEYYYSVDYIEDTYMDINIDTDNDISTDNNKNEDKEEYENIAYEEFMMYAYALSEILPDEVIRKYKFDNNESILIEALLEIDNNIEKAYDLIFSVNSLSIAEKEKFKTSYIKYQKIHDSYKYFYEKKHNNKIENNINILLYFYNSPLQTRDERNIVDDYLKDKFNNSNEIKNIIPKGYFSEKYKESHEIVKIY